MAFHFSLQSVLSLRKNIERQKKLLLLEAAAEVARIDQEIKDADLAMTVLNQSEIAALKPGMRASELQWDGMQRSALHLRREWLKEKRGEAEGKRAVRSEDFQRARRECEILERLRQRQWEIYQQQAAQREQRQLDDLFLAYRMRRRG